MHYASTFFRFFILSPHTLIFYMYAFCFHYMYLCSQLCRYHSRYKEYQLLWFYKQQKSSNGIYILYLSCPPYILSCFLLLHVMPFLYILVVQIVLVLFVSAGCSVKTQENVHFKNKKPIQAKSYADTPHTYTIHIHTWTSFF